MFDQMDLTSGMPPMGDPFQGMGPMPGMQPPPLEDIPDLEELERELRLLPPDPSIPLRPRPTTAVLLDRKTRIMKFWRALHQRMIYDEELYKGLIPVDTVNGQEDIGESETLVLPDIYILVEKIANMVAATDLVIQITPKDPGMSQDAQMVENFLRWWQDEANRIWMGNLNNRLARDEILYLALRGWLTGRLMLDPNDEEFPYRYDLIDPIHVFAQPGAKGKPRWVFHVYKDSKINVLNDMGWDQGVIDRIEEETSQLGDHDDVEVASFYDDVWHVLFLNDEEVWSAPHNYDELPWHFATCGGPPIRRSDVRSHSRSKLDITNTGHGLDDSGGGSNEYTRWWGVSVFEGIKDVYQKLNKLGSAIMTEAMKGPNPPRIIYGNQNTEADGKTIDASAGATNYLDLETEKVADVDYGFKPSELDQLMKMLLDSKNKGSLPSVMYGEGATYLSGFAVSLLSSSARDILYPILKAHEEYRKGLFRTILKLTAQVYQQPINIVGTDPVNKSRSMMSTVLPEQIRNVGYAVNVYYNDVTPRDRAAMTDMAVKLVSAKLISLETARGMGYLGMDNPSGEDDKVLADLANFDPEVVKAMIPMALYRTDPLKLLIWQQAQYVKQLQESMMMLMGMEQSGPPGQSGGAPNANSQRADQQEPIDVPGTNPNDNTNNRPQGPPMQ